jgi:transposase
MAPPHTQVNDRSNRNRDMAALTDYGLGYKRIAKQIGINPSTVRNVVKRYKKRGHVLDTPRTGRPSKITKEVRSLVNSVTLDNPRASLNQLTKLVRPDLDIGRSTVDKVIKELGFKLIVPRKKPWFRKDQQRKRLEWCKLRKAWGKAKWRKVVWLDEATFDYVAYQPGRKVRVKPGEELLDQNLAAKFKSGRILVGCWAAYTHGKRSPLVRIRRRGPDERVTKKDRLGLNGSQYAKEICEPYLVPFLQSLDQPIEEIKVVEDKGPYHFGPLNITLNNTYGINKMHTPANSPDLNPIENVWHIFKAKLRK